MIILAFFLTQSSDVIILGEEDPTVDNTAEEVIIIGDSGDSDDKGKSGQLT